MDKWCLVTILSALYAKLFVVIGLGFITAEIITAQIPFLFYEGYFTYMYLVSILFLGFGCSCLIRNPEPEFTLGRAHGTDSSTAAAAATTTTQSDRDQADNNGSTSLEDNGNNGGFGSINGRRRRTSFILETGIGFGSLLFRLGFLAFGLAAMVYTGLEFGSFFEVTLDVPCGQILRGINPVLRMIFIFAQMYFIFMASRIVVSKFHVYAKLGLMHVFASNLVVWLRTLVEVNNYEMNGSLEEQAGMDNGALLQEVADALTTVTTVASDQLIRALVNETACRGQDIVGSVVSASAPYLCPFLMNFSLVGAAVVYVMWQSVGKPWDLNMIGAGDGRLRLPRRVDCVGASKGLFLGLFVLVTNVICLILFFVLVNRPRLHLLAIYLAHTSHAVVMLVSLMAITAGLVQIRPMLRDSGPKEVDRPLNKLLLHVATFGAFLYGVFGIIAGAITAEVWNEPSLLLAVISGLTIVQITVQCVFLLQVNDRWESRVALATPRPGSHAVTLLLICNVTMLVVAIFEIRHSHVNPIQSQFYGPAVWSVIQAVTLPLCIFYRFQSTVMLASLWKITCLSPSK